VTAKELPTTEELQTVIATKDDGGGVVWWRSNVSFFFQKFSSLQKIISI